MPNPLRLPAATPYLRAGSGEPLLLLHPFLLSHDVWHDVVLQLADQFDVVAMTLPGHWGGPPLRRRMVSIAAFADGIEALLDELGWETCHVAGNSIGGWLSFELARRGRARSVTAVAPAGGWKRFAPRQIQLGLKFVLLAPAAFLGRLTGDLGSHLGFVRNLALRAVSHDPRAVPRERADNYIRATTNCPAYVPYLFADLRGGGVRGLHEVTVPVQILLCEKDWLLPPGKYSEMYTDALPGASVVMLSGVGHVPMLEDPGPVAEAIRSHIVGLASSATA